MSGIVAILNTDGAPCDPALLSRLTDKLAFCGPDGTGQEILGQVGLGATLFKTTFESEHETQPFRFDGDVWIVADCRIDDRARLVAQLRDLGRHAELADPDVQLILHAYLAWGRGCVERLLGDFAFIVWDGRSRELFAARDHIGVKPLFYAECGRTLVVSNVLGCVLSHPDVDRTFNDLAIADFVLFGRPQETSATAYSNVSRLPAAHSGSTRHSGWTVERYWELPTYTVPLRLSEQEIVHRFRELMRVSVGDRLRTRRVAVQLSGGMDSSVVAAAVKDSIATGGANLRVQAWTFGCEELLPTDEERRFAELTAAALGFEHHYFAFDDYPPFRHRDGSQVEPRIEPAYLSHFAGPLDCIRAVSESNRVLLTGEGGDAVFSGSMQHVRRMLRAGQWMDAARQVAGYAWRFRRLPPLGLRSRLKEVFGMRRPVPPFPDQMHPQKSQSLQLRERWTESYRAWNASGNKALRPEADRQLRAAWSATCEAYGVEWLGCRIEVRHPLLDLRLIDFLLQLPSLPWFGNKNLSRQAYCDLVPQAVRHREKAVVQGCMVEAWEARGQSVRSFAPQQSTVWEYLDREKVLQAAHGSSRLDAAYADRLICAISLHYWLCSIRNQE